MLFAFSLFYNRTYVPIKDTEKTPFHKKWNERVG